MSVTSFSFPESLTVGGRLARMEWPRTSPSQAVAATLRQLPDALILRATDANGQTLTGLAPGGLAA